MLKQGEYIVPILDRILSGIWLVAATATLILSAPASSQTYFGSARAVDGDSLEIGDTRFRLFGIDAVEKHQTCDRKGEVWNCGIDASIALRSLVERGSVNCTQRSTDQYGRVVATCLAGGIDLAEQMVRQGYAVALREYSDAYVSAEQAARDRGVGIWSSVFESPSDFRASDPRSEADRQALLDRKARAEQRHQAELRRAESALIRPTAQVPGVYYRNCAEARAAGNTPLYRGQPGYGEHMDGDGDGVACEPYRGRR